MLTVQLHDPQIGVIVRAHTRTARAGSTRSGTLTSFEAQNCTRQLEGECPLSNSFRPAQHIGMAELIAEKGAFQ